MVDVALIGPDQQDNLPLRYLAASLEKAGRSSVLVRFNDRRDTSFCVERICALNPAITGLGIAFQQSVNDYLSLAEALRRGGYRGHITCGGHVPTFCYREILRDAPGISSVVRHEGEHTLVELTNAVSCRASLSGISGLVRRDGNRIVVEPPRPPVHALDELPPPLRTEGRPLTVGGVPIAFVITGRGCFGDCSYCSIQSFGRDAGGPTLRLREIDPVADELSDHYRRHGTRAFFVQDDIFLLPNETRTVKRMEDLGSALDARGLMQPIFWVKGRPESVTGRVAEVARRIGVVHVFLGVENASDERLRYLGRTHRHSDNLAAIQCLAAHGIRPSFNLMLFDPDCTPQDVATTIDFAASVPHLPWNICRTEIYSGTPLFHRLQEEGRLLGDYRNFGYTLRDRSMEILFRILKVSFHERSFSLGSLLNRLISLSFARQPHELMFAGEASAALSRAVDTLIIDAHKDSSEELRYAFDFAVDAAARSDEEIRDFAVASALRINRKNQALYRRYRELWELLTARGEVLFSTTK